MSGGSVGNTIMFRFGNRYFLYRLHQEAPEGPDILEIEVLMLEETRRCRRLNRLNE